MFMQIYVLELNSVLCGKKKRFVEQILKDL